MTTPALTAALLMLVRHADLAPTSHDGATLHVGDLVHYVPRNTPDDDGQDPWTSDRWGIITGFTPGRDGVATVRVTPDYDPDVFLHPGDWYAPADRLAVMAGVTP